MCLVMQRENSREAFIAFATVRLFLSFGTFKIFVLSCLMQITTSPARCNATLGMTDRFSLYASDKFIEYTK